MTTVKLSEVKVGTVVVVATGNQIRKGQVVKQTYKHGFGQTTDRWYRPNKIYTTIEFKTAHNTLYRRPFMNSDRREVVID